MRALLQRLRAGWKQNPWIWPACVGAILAALGWAYTALTGGSGAWEDAANVGQIVGIPLTVLSIAATLLTAARPPAAPQQSARVRLARQVHTQEAAVRAALLGGVVPVDVAFDRVGAPHPARRTATSIPNRDASGSGEPDEAAVAEDLGPARRIQQAVARLVSWKTIPTPSTRSASSGSAATEGAASNNAGAEGQGNLSDIVSYFTALPHQRLVIIGEKGSGKTVLAIELVIGMARAVLDDPSGTGPVAVRFSAATWTRDQLFPLWLAEQLTLTHLVPPTEAKHLIDDHLILPILDGLDEMDIDLDDQEDTAIGATASGDTAIAGVPARAIALISELNRYTAGTAFAPVVLTTRTHRHAQLRARGLLLDHGHTVAIQPLTIQHIGDYLAERYHDHPLQLSAWKPVLTRLNDPRQEGVLAFLSTPWQLMLATTAIDAAPAHAAQLSACHDSTPPERAHQTVERLRRDLLGNFITAATALTPAGGSRFAPRAYSAQQVERWLAQLAHHLHWQEEESRRPDAPPGMSGVDLVPHLLWPIGGHLIPRLLHTLTVAALFTAVFGLGIPSNVWKDIIQTWGGLLTGGQVSPNGLIPLLLYLGIVFCNLLLSARTKWPIPEISPREKVSIHNRVISIAGGLTIGLVFGLLAGLLIGFAHGIPDAISVWVEFGLLGGLAVGLMIGLMGERHSWEPRAEVTSPHQAVHSDLAVGIAFWLAVGLAFELPGGLAVGLTVGLAGGLMLPGSGGARYVFGVALAATRGRLPWRFAAFCQWACAAGLLRTAGAGYQFRHRELQEWLIANR